MGKQSIFDMAAPIVARELQTLRTYLATCKHNIKRRRGNASMSEVAHTPGPWEVSYLDKHGQAVVKAEHIEVATCWHHSVSSIEREMYANAALIALAPTLLSDNQTLRDEVAQLREALECIAQYGDKGVHGNDGICPYGCDTPSIARTALTPQER